MIRVYESFARDHAAMPVVAGRKSRKESFAGAKVTYTIEAMMRDRRALQVRPQCLSHRAAAPGVLRCSCVPLQETQCQTQIASGIFKSRHDISLQRQRDVKTRGIAGGHKPQLRRQLCARV